MIAHHNGFDAVQLVGNTGHPIQAVEGFAVVTVTIGSKQDTWLNLPKAIQYAINTKVRRTRTPHSTQTGSGKHGHHRVNDIGHKTGNTIARLNVIGFEPCGELCYASVKLGIAELLTLAVFTTKHQSRLLVSVLEQISCKIKLGLRKPLGTRHKLALSNDTIAFVAGHYACRVP